MERKFIYFQSSTEGGGGFQPLYGALYPIHAQTVTMFTSNVACLYLFPFFQNTGSGMYLHLCLFKTKPALKKYFYLL